MDFFKTYAAASFNICISILSDFYILEDFLL